MTPDRPRPPKRRSRRADWCAAELVALDFETTGLDLDRDEVISFGLIPIRDGRIALSGQVYQEVAPEADPSHSSIRIHHLRAQDLAIAPAMHDVTDAFRAELDGRFVLAWAAEVEVAFLRKVFGGGKRAWRRRTIDVRTLIMAVERSQGEGSPGYYALTGHAPATDDQRLRDSLDLFPGYGSIVDKLAPSSGEMPMNHFANQAGTCRASAASSPYARPADVTRMTRSAAKNTLSV